METAVVAQQGAQQPLVTADQEDRDVAHVRAVRSNKASMLAASSRLSHAAAPGRAMTTISTGGRPGRRRKHSLTTRLMRLRCTARRETLRDMASPSRASGPAPGAKTREK
jgi:hypothetical protein